jgi:hypothetical protein
MTVWVDVAFYKTRRIHMPNIGQESLAGISHKA